MCCPTEDERCGLGFLDLPLHLFMEEIGAFPEISQQVAGKIFPCATLLVVHGRRLVNDEISIHFVFLCDEKFVGLYRGYFQKHPGLRC